MTGQSDAQRAGKAVPLGVSMRVFLEEIISKEDPPSPMCWGGVIQSLSFLHELGHSSLLPLDMEAPGS